MFSLAILPRSAAAGEEEAEDLAEWTVMLYLCGTDLETEEALATRNLEGIAQTSPVPEVNFIIETGGTREWHAEKLGMTIDPSKLERWSYTDQGFDGTWPSLGGSPLTMRVSDEQEDYILFTTPMKVEDWEDSIRIQYRLDTEEEPHYELIGSSPLDDHTGYPDRNVDPLPSGIEVEPLATLLKIENNISLNFRATEPFVYYADMPVTKEKLPVGLYAVRFVVTDIFGNETCSDPVFCEWDGNRVMYI